jgi:hypothetical protein
VAVEARNLAPLPGDVDFTVGAGLVMPGLTAWQGLFEHGRLRAGQSILVHAPPQKDFLSQRRSTTLPWLQDDPIHWSIRGSMTTSLYEIWIA